MHIVKKSNFVIAEAGVNHEGKLANALKLVAAASRSGCDAIKFQTYSSNSLAARNSPSYWDLEKEPSTNQHELFAKYDKFTIEDYLVLIAECEKLKIEFMTTCFDLSWLKVLDPYLKRHKVASADITNFQLLKAVGQTKKPIILSTGASSFTEINSAINFLVGLGNSKITLLHCVLNYPTLFENANLSRITKLARNFPQYEIGYSDHTVPSPGNHALLMAYSLGAKVFEKHFTLDKSQLGNDHYHAFDEFDFQKFNIDLTAATSAMDYSEARFLALQSSAISNARRGIYLKSALPKNHILVEGDLLVLRPSGEIQASEYFNLIGKRLKRNLPAETLLNRKDVE